jgi:GAF domain
MQKIFSDKPFRSVLNFQPFLDYFSETSSSEERAGKCVCEDIRRIAEQAPALFEPVEDPALLETHADQVEHLMNLVFSPLALQNDAVGAMVPFSRKPLFCSTHFGQLFLDGEGLFQRGRYKVSQEEVHRAKTIKGYLLILRQLYDIQQDTKYPIIHIVPDPKTGLDRHYKLEMDFSFVKVRPLKPVVPLSEEEQARVLEHINDPKILQEILPRENFEFHGFVVLRATDITVSELMLAMEQDLISQDALVSKDGFQRLQQRLRTFFGHADLVASLAAFQNDQVYLLNSGADMNNNCIFQDSQHVSRSKFAGTPFARAELENRIVRVPDLSKIPMPEDHDPAQVKSLMVAPLVFQGNPLGSLAVFAPQANALEPMDAVLMEQLQPMFSMALKKSLDDLDNHVQRVIKEKCTAIHPSVEWRFRQAAYHHLEALRIGKTSELDNIVFKEVYPFYGVSDIRGSTHERNRAIQQDLGDQLKLAFKVIRQANQTRSMLILQELASRIEQYLLRTRQGLGSGDEQSVLTFLTREVESVFALLEGFGPKVLRAIEQYRAAMDPMVGSVYALRKDFEDSVSILNDRLATYLDREEAEMQQVLPHYFERHRTDGVDYLIYAGRSMSERGVFNPLYLKNLRLWQLKVAAGMAWYTHQLKSELKIPLDTAHLVFIQNAPLSIRFLFDEKRFGVDGAYDIRHEIIKSRLDKAVVKGGNERLTQPEKVAVVYSHPQEIREARIHIKFLQEAGYLTGELETLDLEDLPGVQGLKALRVGVDLASEAMARQAEAG